MPTGSAGCKASAALLAILLVQKYLLHLPLYRQHTQLARIGMQVSRTTLAMWMVRLGELVQPLEFVELLSGCTDRSRSTVTPSELLHGPS